MSPVRAAPAAEAVVPDEEALTVFINERHLVTFHKVNLALVPALFGATWLTVSLGWSAQDGFTKGVLPFLIGDTIKLLLAGIALPAAWKLVK